MHTVVRAAARFRWRWWQELLLIGAFYACYESVYFLVDGSRTEAIGHGQDVLAAEHALGLQVEGALNDWWSTSYAVAAVSGAYYVLAHFVVTPAVLAWLYVRRAPRYARWRWTLVLTSFLALAVFWLYPVAPPRLAVPGIVDTFARWDVMGSPADTASSSMVNDFAAMPSLHVAWAFWCAWAVSDAVSSSGRRWWPFAYPALTAFVVVATGNHYLADVVAGVLLVLLSRLAVRAAAGLLARRAQPTPARPIGRMLPGWSPGERGLNGARGQGRGAEGAADGAPGPDRDRHRGHVH